jgi:hypothetical protein
MTSIALFINISNIDCKTLDREGAFSTLPVYLPDNRCPKTVGSFARDALLLGTRDSLVFTADDQQLAIGVTVSVIS